MWEKGKSKVVKVADKNLNKEIMYALKTMSAIVGSTLGPGGRPILLERDGLPPLVTKDGVTVAKSINMLDAVHNIVVECVKEVAERTAKDAGDGTTTSVILAHAIVACGQEWLTENPSVSPQVFFRQVRREYDEIIVPFIKDHARKLDGEEMMRHVAMISANGDADVADAVVEAVNTSGEDGAVVIEESSGTRTYSEVKEGFSWPKGLDALGPTLGSLFVNDEKNFECVFDSPLIVFFNGILSNISAVSALVQQNIENPAKARPMVFVAQDFSDEMKQVFALNMKQGSLKMVPVSPPRDGTNMGREMVMQDLAAYTNGKVFDNHTLGAAKLEELGDCDQFRMARYQTVFLGEPDQDSVKGRIATIKSQINHVDKEIDAEIYRERIARLTGGITTIFVGGRSDLEIRETKARVDDALCAVRAALKDGVVPGGAAMTYRLSLVEGLHPVLKQALKQPLYRLLDNAGVTSEGTVLVTTSLCDKDGQVYDVMNHTFVDPWEAGILDPAKVIEAAIGNALSVAATLVTLGGMVVVGRDLNLEAQKELSDVAFNNMMNAGG